jgi:hypothetical protein
MKGAYEMILSNFAKRLLVGGAIAAAVIGACALAPTTVAHAAAAFQTAVPPQSTPADAQGQPPHARLEKLYADEQKLQTTQQQRLDNTSKVISATQSDIDKQNGLGKDTTALVTALNTYKAAVATAQDEHASAQGILDTHAGFDASGNVTDAAQARTTVQSASQAQREFHLTMNQAGFDLRTQIRLWRIKNRQTVASAAESAIN